MNLDNTMDRIYPLLRCCAPNSPAHDYWFGQLRHFQTMAAEELGKKLRASRNFHIEEYERCIAELEKMLEKYSPKR